MRGLVYYFVARGNKFVFYRYIRYVLLFCVVVIDIVLLFEFSRRLKLIFGLCWANIQVLCIYSLISISQQYVHLC